MACLARRLVQVRIDGTLPENVHPTQALEDSEDVRVLRVPAASLLQQLASLREASGGQLAIDAKLAAIALGMQFALPPPAVESHQ